MTLIPADLRERFLDLECRLSPENLSCDGELSSADVLARRKRIFAEWADLEKEAGRPVTPREVESWLWAPGTGPETPIP